VTDRKDKRQRDKRLDHIVTEITDAGMVIRLPDFTGLEMKETSETRLSLSDASARVCNHWRTGFVIDRNACLVRCRHCGETVDAFKALLEYAIEQENTRRDFTRAREELRDTRLRLEVFERLEKNARERLKRLGVRNAHGYWERNLTAVLKDLVRDVQRDLLNEARANEDSKRD